MVVTCYPLFCNSLHISTTNNEGKLYTYSRFTVFNIELHLTFNAQGCTEVSLLRYPKPQNNHLVATYDVDRCRRRLWYNLFHSLIGN
jgi:hypothetical protein